MHPSPQGSVLRLLLLLLSLLHTMPLQLVQALHWAPVCTCCSCGTVAVIGSAQLSKPQGSQRLMG